MHFVLFLIILHTFWALPIDQSLSLVFFFHAAPEFEVHFPLSLLISLPSMVGSDSGMECVFLLFLPYKLIQGVMVLLVALFLIDFFVHEQPFVQFFLLDGSVRREVVIFRLFLDKWRTIEHVVQTCSVSACCCLQLRPRPPVFFRRCARHGRTSTTT